MNTKHQKLAALTAVLALLPAFASADTGLFVGASVGSSHLDEDFSGVNLDTDASAYRIAGGFRFGNLGLEVGYQDFGDFDETIVIGPVSSRTGISADGWTLGGSLGMPLSDQLSLFGRAGVFFWDADVTVDGFSVDVPDDENPYYGGGARFDVSRNFSLVGDWTRYELDTVNTDVISIGFEYRFGN